MSNEAARDNLTQAEAVARARVVRRIEYRISLDLRRMALGYAGTVRIDFELGSSPENLFVDFRGKTLVRLQLNDQELPVALWNGVRIELPTSILRRRNHLVAVYQNQYDRVGSGFHHFVDPEDDREYLFTDFEPYKAHWLFPCFDQPDLKASYRVRVTAPEAWMIVSNGRLQRVAPAEDECSTYLFEPTARFSTYLVALMAGDYRVFEGPAAGATPLRVLCRQSLAPYLKPDLDEIFDITRRGLLFFEDYFDIPYPFHKYDQIFVPELNAGAMENVAAATLGEHMVFRGSATHLERQSRAETILHEIAHMWFGNLVTMVWWDDLWLNESFATYAAFLGLDRALGHADAWQTFASRIKTWAYRQDQLVSTHPVATPVPDTDTTFLNFDGITYGKGAAALKQLRARIGEKPFRDGLRRYFKENRYHNATKNDFFQAIAAECDHDLGDWAARWIETAGVGSLEPMVRVDHGRIDSFTVRQSPPVPGDRVFRPHAITTGLMRKAATGAIVVAEQAPVRIRPEDTTTINQFDGAMRPDFIVLDAGDETYSRFHLDEPSVRFALQAIDRFADPMIRTQTWGILWQMVRDARLPGAEYCALVADRLREERLLQIVEPALNQCSLALLRYLPERHRGPSGRRVMPAVWQGVSGHRGHLQQVWLRAALNLASEAEDLARIERWLDGDLPAEGAELDQPRRWAAIRRLIAFGRPGARERLRREREADASDLGRKSAFACEVATPTIEAKETAWAAFTKSSNRHSDDYLKAGMGGFNWTHQAGLLAPFQARFHDAVAALRTDRNPDYLKAFYLGLFPYYATDPEMIRRTLDFAAVQVDPQLKRLALESADELRRAARCRAIDD